MPSKRVLNAIFEVSNTLGAGSREKVYQRALLRELALRGISATAEASFPVVDKGHVVNGFSDSRDAGGIVAIDKVNGY